MYQFEANDPVLSRYTDVDLSDGGPNPLEDFTLSRDRMAEALKNSKKALKICSQNNPVILGDLLKCYGKLIEVYLKSEKYDEGMKTFEKIKMFNLSSVDAKGQLISEYEFSVSKSFQKCNEKIVRISAQKSEVFKSNK